MVVILVLAADRVARLCPPVAGILLLVLFEFGVGGGSEEEFEFESKVVDTFDEERGELAAEDEFEFELEFDLLLLWPWITNELLNRSLVGDSAAELIVVDVVTAPEASL